LYRAALRPSQPPVRLVLRLFPGIKQPRSGVDHPPPSSTKVKERVWLYLYLSPFVFIACYREKFMFVPRFSSMTQSQHFPLNPDFFTL